MHEDDNENKTSEQESQQALEPAEQDSIAFHGENIIAVRLADGRICVVIRWVCESLKLAPNGQVRKIRNTAATAKELVRVRVQTRGGPQNMPAITLRGFSPWILSINPGEVKHDDAAEEERIRALVVAFQEEAKDALYEHFVSKGHRGLPEPRTTIVTEQPVPSTLAQPQEPQAEATDAEKAAYYEDLAVWALWKASQHNQAWRGAVEMWRGQLEARLESQEAIGGLLPEILERLGPEKISTEHQTNIRSMVQRLEELSGTPYQTIYWELAQAFQAPRYTEILESQYEAVCQWFQRRIEAAKKPKRGKP